MITNYIHLIFASWLIIAGQELALCDQNYSSNQNEIPSARSGYAIAYDANRDVVILFGGQDSASKKLGDTWEWFKGTWKRINIKGPSSRINSTMTYDAEAKSVLIFGGLTDSGYQNDLWAYDGKSWEKLTISSSPPARQLATMVFDKKQSQLVLFGGMDINRNPMGDTWTMKNNKWKKINIEGPSPRATHSMTYNDDLGTIFLYGGYDTTILNDLWELKDGNWISLNTKDGPFRCHASISYDQSKKRMLVFGGFGNEGRTNELWQYSNNKWLLIKAKEVIVPDPRAEHESVFIPGAGLFIFGGVIGIDPDTRNRGNDTWLYNEESWKKLNE